MATRMYQITTALLCVLLTGCVTTGEYKGKQEYQYYVSKLGDVHDAAPADENLSEYGNPSFYRVDGKRYVVLKNAIGYDKVGTASWYGPHFHGQLTANREKYDMYAMTAASKVLPIPTYVRVTNLENGREAVVRINDRGPFHSDRIIDLSFAAAAKLGFAENGTANVRVTALTSPSSANGMSDQARQYLQVASFSNLHNAERFKTYLSHVTQYPVLINPSEKKNGQTIYRVAVGPFVTLAMLMKEKDFLYTQGFEKTVAVLG